MSGNIFSIDCDTDNCGDGLPFAAGSSPNGCLGSISESEIDSIILLDPVNGTLVNWSNSMTALDWNIDNSDATGAALKRFIGIGNITDEEGETYIVASGVEKTAPYIFTLNFTMQVSNNAMRDYWRTLKCNEEKPKIYCTTRGRKVLGGENAISLRKLTVQIPQEEGSFDKVIITAIWDAKTAPDRENSPLPLASEL